MIGIVDYGLGNIQAILNIYKKLNIEAMSAKTADDLRTADKLILPGVGSFDWAMKRLNESGMRDPLDELVKKSSKPILGICVGLQMMGNRSDEGEFPGLGWLDGEVKRFDPQESRGAVCLPRESDSLLLPALVLFCREEPG